MTDAHTINLPVTEEEVQTLFMAHATIKLDSMSDVNDNVNMVNVTRLASQVLPYSQQLRNVNDVMKIFKYYQDAYGIKNYAEYLDMINKREHAEYRDLILREGYENLERMADDRKFARTLERRDMNLEARMAATYLMIEMVLPHVTYETLLSWDMFQQLTLGLFVQKEQYDQCARRAILQKPLGVGALRPVDASRYGEARRRATELEYGKKIVECIEFGPQSCWNQQMNLYYNDIARLAKFASFQALASADCYNYLGQRFRYRLGLDPARRKMELELYHHVRIVSEVIERFDAIEMARIKKTFPDDYYNFIARKQEMVEIEHRFGTPFNRFADESQVLQPESYVVRKGWVVIFYAILREVRLGATQGPNVRRVVQQLLDLGKLDHSRTVDFWVNSFREDSVKACAAQRQEVRMYLDGVVIVENRTIH